MMTAEAVAKEGIRAMFNKQASVVTGFANKIVAAMSRLLPSQGGLALTEKVIDSAVGLRE